MTIKISSIYSASLDDIQSIASTGNGANDSYPSSELSPSSVGEKDLLSVKEEVSRLKDSNSPNEDNQCTLTDKDVYSSNPKTTKECSSSPGLPFLPGGEKRTFDAKVEEEGSKKVFDALSEDEKELIPDDNMPLRYFRAEKGNVKSAIKKIKYTLKWRRDFEVDKIKNAFEPDGDLEMKKILEKQNETGKIYVRGYDKNGRAIIYLRPGMENTFNDEINNMKHLVYQLERAVACTAKNGLEKYVVIIDYIGFKIRNSPPLSITKHTVHILENHYPERMYKAYVCNPPRVFTFFYNMIKPFIDESTKQKIVFCVGKKGEKIVQKDLDMTKIEKCAFGTSELRDFDSKEYLYQPISTTFDEHALIPTKFE